MVAPGALVLRRGCGVSYELWLCAPSGQRILFLEDVLSFSYTRALNTVGAWSVTMPDTFNLALVKPDARIQIWRRAEESGSPQIEMVGFLRKPVFQTDDRNMTTIVLNGPDILDILRRRIVAYPATDTLSESNKSGKADDMLKAIVRENLGSSATAARNLTALGFTVAADAGLGPTVTKAFSWRKLPDVFKEICDAAAAKGTPVYYDYAYLSDTSFEFRTYVGRRGNDHSLTSGAPVVIGLDFGTLSSPVLEEDASAEVNHIYAGGIGEGLSRTIVEVEDAARIGLSPVNRCEGFVDARDQTTTPGVTDQANAGLKEGRARTRFSGNVLSGPGARYGIEWGFGDVVVATYMGRQFNASIKTLSVSMDAKGKETLTARLELEV